MVRSTSRDGSKPRSAHGRNDPRVQGQSEDDNRQPEMSEPARPQAQDVEPASRLVPDHRDDIVVSHASDF